MEAAIEVYLDINRSYRCYSVDRQRMYEYDLAKRLPTCPKLFHSYVRRKKRGCSAVGPLKVGDEVLVEPTRIAEAFADYFSELYAGGDVEMRFRTVPTAQMDPVQLSYDGVKLLLLSLDSCGAMGPDSIHPSLLKACATLLAYPLTLIFARSLTSRSVPEE